MVDIHYVWMFCFHYIDLISCHHDAMMKVWVNCVPLRDINFRFVQIISDITFVWRNCVFNNIHCKAKRISAFTANYQSEVKCRTCCCVNCFLIYRNIMYNRRFGEMIKWAIWWAHRSHQIFATGPCKIQAPGSRAPSPEAGFTSNF